MRMSAMVLAVLGGLAGGFLGLTWLRDAGKADQYRDVIKSGKSLGLDMSKEEAAFAEIDKLKIAAYLLVGSLAAGAAGAFLAFQGNTKIAGPVMLAGALAPALLAPKALVFTFLLLVGGVLALLAKPAAAPAVPAAPQVA